MKLTRKKPGKQQTANRNGTPGTVEIRMYCMGTGDCLVLRFFKEDGVPYVMMIDCGSCRGDKKDFMPYLQDLAGYVRNHIDLLVVTHEHQDHVNGFHKCRDIFAGITISNVWFAWTENPDDPSGHAAELRKKKKELKNALGLALAMIREKEPAFRASVASSPFSVELQEERSFFVRGLQSLSEINLEDTAAGGDGPGRELAGMAAVKALAREKNANIAYLLPGTTVKIKELPGISFHILGPPADRSYIYKDGKEGKDVYRKAMDMGISSHWASALTEDSAQPGSAAVPFAAEFVLQDAEEAYAYINGRYRAPESEWRDIDNEWLWGAGQLAIRLNSHINNTSLAMAVESEKSKKVLLLPGDAEYGSWESWHAIKAWDKKGGDGRKHFVEDLLNRTVYYKVGHHLSYNGTALEKGIRMMPERNLVAFATLDRKRISDGWKSTMPNKYLLEELIKRTEGRFFIMNEAEITDPPSATFDPAGDERFYTETKAGSTEPLFKQYTIDF